MNYCNNYLYYFIINLVFAFIAFYITFKTKYLDFIINPSNRFYKRNFKTYINNNYTNQKRTKFIKKSIDQINKEKENTIQNTQINDFVSYKSVFYRLYILIILILLSGIITYSVILNKLEIENIFNIFFSTFCIMIFFYFIRFLCYYFLDIYLFSSLISNLFSILFSLLYGVYIACFYRLEYKLLLDIGSSVSYKILNYFILLFIILPFFLTFIVIFIISFLYRNNKIKVNDKFQAFLKKIFIISFFTGTSFLPPICSHSSSLFVLILYLLEALFFLILYSLIWVNTLNQLDRFIEQKIPKKYGWLLVFFLLESCFIIFLEILTIIARIINYFVKKK